MQHKLNFCFTNVSFTQDLYVICAIEIILLMEQKLLKLSSKLSRVKQLWLSLNEEVGFDEVLERLHIQESQYQVPAWTDQRCPG